MTTPLIYICEDDPDLGKAIMSRLQDEGYRVTWFADPQDMDEQGNSEAPDLLLLDVQLPGETGYSIAKRYLRTLPGLRVIMMSVLSRNEDLMLGYESGAMVYLPKPFKPEALLACLSGIFGTNESLAQLASAQLSLNMQTHKLAQKDEHVLLTANEARVLSFLALRSPAVAEYYEIMEVMGIDLDHARQNTLEAFMSRLRRKLVGFDRDELTLQNKRNSGYALKGNLIIKN
jgi:DNA-binding response OmpR family regulator|tara:strand:- start:74 stop:766 length:693 start_codon:yes stop_codon:yes gene_type:complete